MFGFGWGEMVVIGIVALIAIGPKELPTVLRSIGFWMGKVRRMANEFQGQFNEALREAELTELTDLKKQAEDLTSDITNFDPLADAQKDIERSFEIQDPLKETDASATATDAAPPPEAPPLPEIDVPMPALPEPVTEKDFAPAEPPPHEAHQEPTAEPQKQAGSGA